MRRKVERCQIFIATKISTSYNINLTKKNNPCEGKLIWGPGFHKFPYNSLVTRGGRVSIVG